MASTPGLSRALLGLSLAALTASLACADPNPETSDAGETDASTESGETGEVEGLDEHGQIHIETGALAGDTTVFDGTATVVVTVHYLACLRDFYLGSGFDWRQTGTDGGPVFDAYIGRPCADFDAPPNLVSPACTLTDIQATLDGDANDYYLTVTYAIDDPASLVDGDLPVGPLPVEALAGCSAQVEVRSTGVEGFDQGGDQLWRIGTVSGSNQATVGDDTPLRVEIVAN